MNEGVIAFIVFLLAGLYIILCTSGIQPVSPETVFQHKHVHTHTHTNIRKDPNPEPSGRPECTKWYKVRRGDTQWGIANRYAHHDNHWRWIKSMRWVSRKSEGDEDLKAGESVCVAWYHST